VHTVVHSETRTVVIGPDQPFCIIGERINPTGRTRLEHELRQGDLSRLDVDVAEQVAGGAMVLDVNMGTPLGDEVSLMTLAVRRIQDHTDLPLCVDSSVIEALEAGLAAYRGKALVNSVNASDARLAAILPLVKRYGAAVIALANDDEEIPPEPARRLQLARKIVDVATGRYGIAREDIVLDPLATPIGADPAAVERTLETIALITAELGVNTTLGASNVSFGRPAREGIVGTFLPLAMAAGLTSAIMDARSPGLVRAVRAGRAPTRGAGRPPGSSPR
jgi:5-methyltetrahydrofolate--homocysteine methyltransferase